ncbi:MAG: divergent polysaccharide deacetylase family protein [Acidobacteria bacterium]|nr:divergent polysaccharide deacetylase family protein [Acidobacteriota bacterium]
MPGREGKRGLTRRTGSFKTVALLMLIPVGGIVLFFLWSFLHNALSLLHRPAHSEASVLGTQHRGDIVLILDDVGFDHQPLSSAMAIDPNVNFAVLPNGRRSIEFASTLHARGFELLCHLPMEPEGFPRISPGDGAVLTTMSDAEIATATRANIESIRFARGVNNHMGSRATADRRVMTDVLGALPKGMYFIDSKTTGNSIAGPLARTMRVKTASRNVFLDDVQEVDSIRRQLAELANTASTRGVSVGIGHMYPSTIQVLTEDAPKLRAEGFRFVRASAVVR